MRLRNCTGRADLKQGRVLLGLRGAALIRCHYAEWDLCYCVWALLEGYSNTFWEKKAAHMEVMNDS